MFAVIVYFIVSASQGTFISNEVSDTIDGYVAKEVGIQANDRIVQINNTKISNKNDLNKVLDKTNGENIDVKVLRNDELIDYNLKPTEVKSKYTGLYLDENCKIVFVEKGSTAEKQGVKDNDKLIKVNEEDINGDVNKALEIIHGSESEKINITVKRGDETISFELSRRVCFNILFGC